MPSNDEEDQHNSVCYYCKKGGDLLCCDTCNLVLTADTSCVSCDSCWVTVGNYISTVAGGSPGVAAMIDLSIAFVQTPQSYIGQLIMAILAVLLVGLGSGIYLIANLGPGPRDGLMTGIQRKTNLPIAAVRAFLEITVVSIGWYLGGTVGIETLLFAFGIGPAVALGLFLVAKTFS